MTLLHNITILTEIEHGLGKPHSHSLHAVLPNPIEVPRNGSRDDKMQRKTVKKEERGERCCVSPNYCVIRGRDRTRRRERVDLHCVSMRRRRSRRTECVNKITGRRWAGTAGKRGSMHLRRTKRGGPVPGGWQAGRHPFAAHGGVQSEVVEDRVGFASHRLITVMWRFKDQFTLKMSNSRTQSEWQCWVGTSGRHRWCC